MYKKLTEFIDETFEKDINGIQNLFLLKKSGSCHRTAYCAFIYVLIQIPGAFFIPEVSYFICSPVQSYDEKEGF
jgi:hypothetical protein